MANDKIKVLYIAGWGRSGSTILGNILGELEGFVNVGELCKLWDFGLKRNWLCGCGVPFKECDFWSGIVREEFGCIDHVDLRGLIESGKVRSRYRYIPFMYLPGGGSVLRCFLKSFWKKQEAAYRRINEVTQSRVIVDSSKNPVYAFGLGRIPSIELYVVHLIRDPRATAYSLLRKKLNTHTGRYVGRNINPLRTIAEWIISNVASERMLKFVPNRCLKIRYEEFVRMPKETIRSIVDMVGESNSDFPFVDNRRVELSVQHTVAGNLNRFQIGIVELRPDDEWKIKMKQRDKHVVTAITWPLLLRYGYLFDTDRGRDDCGKC